MPTDLNRFRDAIGDPDKYFVHFNGTEELVVPHETGEPEYRITAKGIQPYRKPERGAQAPTKPSEGLGAVAAPAGFHAAVQVTAPGESPPAG